MSSGSSNIDPTEVEDRRPPPLVDSIAEQRRRGTLRRRQNSRSTRAEFMRPNIEVARHNAQEIYRRRRNGARQRSSGQQTDTVPRTGRLVVQGGHVTMLLRLLSRNGQPDVDTTTTIRMRIDIPESVPNMPSFFTTDTLQHSDGNASQGSQSSPSNPQL